MADIELVIKMPEEDYEHILHRQKEYCVTTSELEDVIASGTPLPKGHGRIIDEDKITKCEQIGLIIKDGNLTRCLTTDAPTIIERDHKKRWPQKARDKA